MSKFLLILFVTLSTWSLSGQEIVSKTKIIDADGLKNLVVSAKGRPVLLNFWATWCGPCHSEFPELIKIDADYRARGLVFNIVSVDSVGLVDSAVPEFLEQYGSTMISYLLDLPNRRAVARAVRKISPKFPDTYPLTLLFDRNGKLVYQKVGKINEKILRREIGKTMRSE